MNASVVIRFDGDDVDVRVLDHGEEPTEEEARWLAFLALPHLGRKAFATEDGYDAYKLELAKPLIQRKLSA